MTCCPVTVNLSGLLSGHSSVIEDMARTQGVPVSNPGGIWQLRHFVSLDISYFDNIVFINCLGKK